MQQVDLYDKANLIQPSRDPSLHSTPTQPPSTSRWPGPEDQIASPIQCLTLSYDSTVLLSGHQNGKVQTWNISRLAGDVTLTDFSSPVTNIEMLPPTGFPNIDKPSIKLRTVVKPRFGAFSDSSSTPFGNDLTTIPESYICTAQLFTPLLTSPQASSFSYLISHPNFPETLLTSSLAFLLASTNPSARHSPALAEETEALRAELSVLRASQAGHADKAIALNAELRKLKAVLKQKRRLKDARREKVAEAEFRWREASMQGEVVGVKADMNIEEMMEATRQAVEGMRKTGKLAAEEWEAERKGGAGREEGDEELEQLSSDTELMGSD